MKMITCIDLNNAIGIDGDLLAYLPSDLKRFKELTTDNIVIMGKRTLESLPNGKPLPNRTNIVVTRNKSFSQEGVYPITCLNTLRAEVWLLKAMKDVDAFVIGGGEIYRELLPDVNTLYITRINHEFEHADTFFPELDMSEWKTVEVSEMHNEGGLDYQYITYERIASHGK